MAKARTLLFVICLVSLAASSVAKPLRETPKAKSTLPAPDAETQKKLETLRAVLRPGIERQYLDRMLGFTPAQLNIAKPGWNKEFAIQTDGHFGISRYLPVKLPDGSVTHRFNLLFDKRNLLDVWYERK